MSIENRRVKIEIEVFMDGDQWCLLMGEDLQTGHAGFDKTIEGAVASFLDPIDPREPTSALLRLIQKKLDSPEIPPPISTGVYLFPDGSKVVYSYSRPGKWTVRKPDGEPMLGPDRTTAVFDTVEDAASGWITYKERLADEIARQGSPQPDGV